MSDITTVSDSTTKTYHNDGTVSTSNQKSFENELKELICRNQRATRRSVKYINVKEQLIDGTPLTIEVTYEYS